MKITEKLVQEHIFAKLQPKEQNIIMRVYLAGMKLVFSPQTLQQMLDGFEQQMKQHDNVGENLGTDVVHIMLILFEQSKGTMPPGAIIPAGTMLLAKLLEFLNETKRVPVTDEDFAAGAHLMTTVLLAKFNTKYHQQLNQSGALQQPTMPAAPMAQPTPTGA